MSDEPEQLWQVNLTVIVAADSAEDAEWWVQHVLRQEPDLEDVRVGGAVSVRRNDA